MRQRGWQRYRELGLVMVLLLAPTLLYLANTQWARPKSVIDDMAVVVVAPVQWVVISGIDALISVWERYLALTFVERENERLRTTVHRLVAQNAQLNEELKHMEALRRLVAMPERPEDHQLVHAAIVAASPSPLFRSVRIDRGEEHGITPGAAVLTHEGIVGRIAAVYGRYAEVMLLTDANSSTDVLVQRTRARARVRGQGGDSDFALDMQYLSRVDDVEPGDVLVTGGLGHTFPKGLPVGRVATIERRAFGLYQRATIVPSVDFSRLEHVLIAIEAKEGPQGAAP